MEYEFGYWYVLLALLILPGFYFLYRFYTKTKKSNSLKFSNLELVKKIRLITISIKKTSSIHIDIGSCKFDNYWTCRPQNSS